MRECLSLPVPAPGSTDEQLFAVLAHGGTHAGLTGALSVEAPVSVSTWGVLEEATERAARHPTCSNGVPTIEAGRKVHEPGRTGDDRAFGGAVQSGAKPLMRFFVFYRIASSNFYDRWTCAVKRNLLARINRIN